MTREDKDKVIEIINNGLHDTQCMSCEGSFDVHRNNILEQIEALPVDECQRCRKFKSLIEERYNFLSAEDRKILIRAREILKERD